MLSYREFQASIVHSAEEVTKVIFKPMVGVITHTAEETLKVIFKPFTVDIVHTALVRKSIVTGTRIASITHTAIFARAVTTRRQFQATIVHNALAYATLPLKALTGGGAVIVKKVIQAIFD